MRVGGGGGPTPGRAGRQRSRGSRPRSAEAGSDRGGPASPKRWQRRSPSRSGSAVSAGTGARGRTSAVFSACRLNSIAVTVMATATKHDARRDARKGLAVHNAAPLSYRWEHLRVAGLVAGARRRGSAGAARGPVPQRRRARPR